MAIKEGLLADFDHEMGTTRKLLERLPDDKLSWKPHEKSMTLGGLATHLGNIPNWADSVALNNPGPSGDPASPHYRDLFELWARGKYFPIFFTRTKVESVVDERLMLISR